MSEFEQFLDQYNQSLEKYGEAYREASGWLAASESWYETLRQTREAELRIKLHDKGLAICADRHYDSIAEEYGPKKIDKPSAEDLGVFPREKMKLRLAQGVAPFHDLITGDNSYRALEISLLCPDHFAASTGFISSPKWPDWPLRVGEVTQEKGRFVLKQEGVDITDLVKWAQDRQTYYATTVMLEGNPHPDIFIYHHFGIPDMPERPNLNKIR